VRFVIQRVTSARVDIDGQTKASIGKGFAVLIGIGKGDDEAVADKLISKMIGLRIFEDSEGKTNLDLSQVGGKLLLISQFTLYADCSSRRPGFTQAARPEISEPLYELVISECRKRGFEVGTGVFGADMKVESVNDGPVTILLDTKDFM
jgi:D-tyrosyl-tRNA(Tyr) deacylase